MTGGFFNECVFKPVSARLYRVLSDRKLKHHQVELRHYEHSERDSPFYMHKLPRFLDPAQPHTESSVSAENKSSGMVLESTCLIRYRVDPDASLEELCGAWTSATAFIEAQGFYKKASFSLLYEEAAHLLADIHKKQYQIVPTQRDEVTFAISATLSKEERQKLKLLNWKLKEEKRNLVSVLQQAASMIL